MKKLGFMMSLMLGLFVSVCALTACSSDDDDDKSTSNPLVGTWYSDSENQYAEITFKADYTCTSREYNSDRTKIEYSDRGTYEIAGNTLSIWWESAKSNWDKEGPWTTIFTISGNKMTTTENNGVVWTKK